MKEPSRNLNLRKDRSGTEPFLKILFLVLTIFGVQANAASPRIGRYSGTISGIDTRTDGTFLINFSAVTEDSAVCQSGDENRRRMAGTVSSPGGKAVLSNAMLAFTNKASVIIGGKGTCSVYGGIEDISLLLNK